MAVLAEVEAFIRGQAEVQAIVDGQVGWFVGTSQARPAVSNKVAWKRKCFSFMPCSGMMVGWVNLPVGAHDKMSSKAWSTLRGLSMGPT